MDGTMRNPAKGRPHLSLWESCWSALQSMRPAFSHVATFMWFATVVAASPAFADELFDACFKMATDRVGHVSQTAHRHFTKFVRECIRGSIPLPETASAVALASQRSKT